MRRKPSIPGELLKFAALAGLLVWLTSRGAAGVGYNWQWYRVPAHLFSFEGGQFAPGRLLQGLAVTLEISGAGLVFSCLFGLAAALLRLSDSIVGRWLARGYVEIIRNTPLLIQILFIYFVLAPVLDLGRFASAVLALSLFEGAYASEILRAGIVSIDRGQHDAAHSLGLSTFQTYRQVILPQALRRILPPLTGQAVSLIKDSALVSIIAINDLTMQGQSIVAETFLSFEVWFTVAAVYLAITLTLSFLAQAMEGRLKLAT